MIALEIDEALRPLVRVGLLLSGVEHVVELDAALTPALADAEQSARGASSADTAPARTLYRTIRLDPTRIRPSSEALLRRVRKGEALPRINTVVDIGNWCSLEFQLPYGLYDAGRLAPPLRLATGGPGDAYAGIRKDVVHLDGRFALFDAQGPFGNPSSDSARTMVGTATRQVLTVVYAPAAVGTARMAHVIDTTSERLRRYAGGQETARQVY